MVIRRFLSQLANINVPFGGTLLHSIDNLLAAVASFLVNIFFYAILAQIRERETPNLYVVYTILVFCKSFFFKTYFSFSFCVFRATSAFF